MALMTCVYMLYLCVCRSIDSCYDMCLYMLSLCVCRSMDSSDGLVVMNCTENRWIVEGLVEDEKYVFAVSATNSQGTSDFSSNSTLYTYVPSPSGNILSCRSYPVNLLV